MSVTEHNRKKYLIVVGGPTASGKTEFSIQLARHFNTHILSCDSRQFYREMNIGTAKPTESELSQAPHHFIGHLSIDQEYSVGDYERDALALLEKLFAEHRFVILSGGSGLFIKAVCEGLDEFPEVPTSIKDQLQEDYKKHGLVYLQEELARTDPSYYETVDRQNPHRLLRALGVIRASGQAFSSFRRQDRAPRPFQPIYLQMDWPREELYQRINQRVDQMLEAGLPAEARGLFHLQHLNALQTVGYQEFFDFFKEKITLEEAIELVKRNSRRYAKRQMTWFRRDGFWQPFTPAEIDTALGYIYKITGSDES
jgi:tRNA dimethylallyltransferase